MRKAFSKPGMAIIMVVLLTFLFLKYGRLSHFLAIGLGTGTLAFIAWYVWPEEIRRLLRQAADFFRSIWKELVSNDPDCPNCGKKGKVLFQGVIGKPEVGEQQYGLYCSCPCGNIWSNRQTIRHTPGAN